MQQIGNGAFYWYTGDIKANFNQLSKVCCSENMLNPSLLLLRPCLHVPFDWCRMGPPKFQQCGPTERLFQQMCFGEQVRLKQQKPACWIKATQRENNFSTHLKCIAEECQEGWGCVGESPSNSRRAPQIHTFHNNFPARLG